MNKKSGIYIIKNKINNKVYIGQSVNIQVRWYAHINSARHTERQDHYTAIHQAMNKYGIENFWYEVLEYCDYQELNDKEQYWIEYYNSYCGEGYNMSPGGEDRKGEANGRAILTVSQVEEIRAAYANHITFREVYEKYKNTISKRGLQKVWHFETWRNIMPEVYTDENRQWHATVAKGHINGNMELGVNNQQRACTEEEISEMRALHIAGWNYKQIGEKLKRSPSVVRKYCLFQESTNINKIANSKQVKNIETGLVFESLTQAAKWAHCSRDTISKYLNNANKTAGYVPTTHEPAHWIS